MRIMPEIFDVTDDPTQPLFGHEEVDDEGVPDKPLSLVEKGVLKDFLRTRQPVARLQRFQWARPPDRELRGRDAGAHQPSDQGA